MKTLVTINVVIFLIIAGIAVGWGLDLKKWYSWLLGTYAFISFFLVGLVGTGSINEAIKAGILFAFLIMFGGAVMRWNREHAEKWLSDHDKKEK
jgi:hypothetical protein